MEKTAVSKKTVIGWAVSVLLAILLLCLPVTASFTASIKLFLAITVFFISLVAFELVPTIVAAILLPTFYAFAKLVPMGTAFTGYSGAYFWMVIGAMVLGLVMNETGILKRISFMLIKALGGTFKGAVWATFIATLAITILTFGNGWLIVLPVALGIIKALDLKPSYESGLICFAAGLGGLDAAVFAYAPGTVAMINTFMQEFVPGFACNLFTCLIFNWTQGVMSAVVLWLLIRAYEKRQQKTGGISDVGNMTKDYFSMQLSEMGPVSVDEYKSIGLFVILLVVAAFLTFTGRDNSFVFMLLPYLAFLPVIGCNVKASKALSGVGWGGIFFATSCVSIGAVGSACGFATWFSGVALTLASGKGILFTCLMFMVIIIIGNFALTPSALMATFATPFAQVASAIGMAPLAAMMCILHSQNIIFLPHEISGYLLVFGLGYWPIKQFIKQGTVKAVVYLAGFIVIAYPLWNLLGLLH